MRKLYTLFASVILSTGAVGIAGAQDYSSPQPNVPQATAEAALSIMTGESIYSLAGDEIGTIEEIVVNPDGDDQVVVSVGEFLGLGGKQVLIASSELSARSEGGYSVSYTEEQLEGMPEYEAET